MLVKPWHPAPPSSAPVTEMPTSPLRFNSVRPTLQQHVGEGLQPLTGEYWPNSSEGGVVDVCADARRDVHRLATMMTNQSSRTPWPRIFLDDTLKFARIPLTNKNPACARAEGKHVATKKTSICTCTDMQRQQNQFSNTVQIESFDRRAAFTPSRPFSLSSNLQRRHIQQRRMQLQPPQATPIKQTSIIQPLSAKRCYADIFNCATLLADECPLRDSLQKPQKRFDLQGEFSNERVTANVLFFFKFHQRLSDSTSTCSSVGRER